MRHAATLAVDVKAQLAFWIFCREINFAGRRVESFGHNNEMMDQLFHLRHDMRFRRRHVFPIHDINRPVRQFIDNLAQDPHALPHLLNTHQITIITISRTADHDIEIVILIIEIWVLTPQIMFDPASTQIWTGKRVGNRPIFRDDADVSCSIDKNTITGKQFIAFVEARHKSVEKLFELRNEIFWEIANLSTDASIRGGEARSRQQLEKIVKFFALGEGVEEDRHCAEVEGHRADTQ